MRYDISPEKLEEQIKREEIQRETALGKRFTLAQGGFLGPVISRWINASVSPVAIRTRECCKAYHRRDMRSFGRLLDTQTFGLAEAYNTGSPEYLEPILRWATRGSSPGRLGTEVTFAEDLVLSVLGRTISDLAMRSLSHKAQGKAEGLSLAMVLSNAATAARECALGQFITMVQGASAMVAIKRPDRSTWAQTNKMKQVGRVLASQVRHALDGEAKGEINLEHVGARTVVKILQPTKEGALQERRISIKAEDLDADAWALLGLAVFPKGEDDPAKNAWLTFAMMVLCAAQVEHGWFDLVASISPKHLKGKKTMRPTRYLILSEKPKRHLKSDLDKWCSMGFTFEPMIVPPNDGTYLTVQTRAVTGRNGPHGWRTQGEGTTAWDLSGDVMASTPWQVSKYTLNEIQQGGSLMEIAQMGTPEELTRRLILGAYQKDSYQDEIYLPLYMDFRGRIYPRTSWVSYQGGDLQKGLLRFTPSGAAPDEIALALHVTSLMGHDKKALPERLAMYRGLDPRRDTVSVATSEEPIQLWTALDLLGSGRADQIPIQIDGTCNGLQHLSAMFRDADAAPWVNLASASYDEPPNDLYREVAGNASTALALLAATGEAWAMRFMACGAVINRSVVKRPVMVLPYGGTMVAIEEGVTEGILAQAALDGSLWAGCLKTHGMLDPEAIAAGYMAFKDRAIGEHPLFRKDIQRLSKVVYDAIRQVIPKAMAAMDAFKSIASCVGDRSLEWSNGVGENPMWIVHAYPKSERRTNVFRGFHLPNSVRGLAMKCGRDEVNPTMHRTGIVANFIHSQDAAHLVETMRSFRRLGGTSFGANHDCLYGRSSEAKILGAAVREAFVKRYDGDPLQSPVRLRSAGEDGKLETFGSWYDLARAFGVDFPEIGRWDPKGVMKSAWFFS